MNSPDLYAKDREAMVALIEKRGVSDAAVLAAMRQVPRHLFVAEGVRHDAYADEPLGLSHGQTISQPYIVAFMTEAAGIKSGSKVLEVGTGSGYQAAILAQMGAQVWSLEIVPELAQTAIQNLTAAGIRNVTVIQGDGSHGYIDAAPYDAILVAAAPHEVPQALLEQLKDGGRLVIPVFYD
jgi:protein-L-isoaspartate(D-aspartate) O-methyltransferase